MSDWIEVDYRFPAGTDVAKHAQIIAVGQTAGTWSERFAHRDGQLRAHLGEVVGTQALMSGHGLATVRFPRANVEGDIGSLLTMIFGKYSMAGAAKVVAVRLPDDYGLRPAVGLSGIREATGVQGRPLVMAIFKPALGLTADDHAVLLREVAEAGLDVIKDDEILPDVQPAPTLERIRACRTVIDEVAQKEGRALLYAVNLTAAGGSIGARASQLVEAGANALLLNVLPYGYQALAEARRAVDVPIFAHPALAGALCGAPDHGLAYSVVLGTLMAHGGADAVLHPSHYGSLPFEPEEEFRIRDILRSRDLAPTPAAGIKPAIVPRAREDYGDDVILCAGTGIMDHPDGPAGGVRAFTEALAG